MALGKSRKKWLADNQKPLDAEIRQYLTAGELELTDLLLSENAVMLKLGMDYHQRKAQLQDTALHHFRKTAIKGGICTVTQ